MEELVILFKPLL
jgi:hypothetical protein